MELDQETTEESLSILTLQNEKSNREDRLMVIHGMVRGEGGDMSELKNMSVTSVPFNNSGSVSVQGGQRDNLEQSNCLSNNVNALPSSSQSRNKVIKMSREVFADIDHHINDTPPTKALGPLPDSLLPGRSNITSQQLQDNVTANQEAECFEAIQTIIDDIIKEVVYAAPAHEMAMESTSDGCEVAAQKTQYPCKKCGKLFRQ